jgi:crotonobetainyl-CoA:carnitine CoA-transferase CaiB-like acyl-CoA transferase
MDVAVQARSGVMAITGHGGPEGPVKPGVSLSDFSGGVHLSVAILAALVRRQETGVGEDVRVSLLDATMSMLINYSVAVTDGQADIAPMGSGHPQLAPFEAVGTSDGFVVIAPGTNRLFADLCRLLRREDLLDDPRFASNPLRVRHRPELMAELKPLFAERTTKEWLVELEDAGIPCAPVNSIREAFADEQLVANGMLRTVQHPRLGALTQLGSPYQMGGRQLPVRLPPPGLGEHTAEVLRELLDLDPDALAQLADQRVI